jgi:hypothetical protein
VSIKCSKWLLLMRRPQKQNQQAQANESATGHSHRFLFLLGPDLFPPTACSSLSGKYFQHISLVCLIIVVVGKGKHLSCLKQAPTKAKEEASPKTQKFAWWWSTRRSTVAFPINYYRKRLSIFMNTNRDSTSTIL